MCQASTMPDEQPAKAGRQELQRALETGPCHRFSDWPDQSVPKVAAGVYTVWEHGRFIYVGMAGRGLAPEDIDAPDEPTKTKGLCNRLDSHASGRRSVTSSAYTFATGLLCRSFRISSRSR